MFKKWIRKAFTKQRVAEPGRKRRQDLLQGVPPSEKLVLFIEFSLGSVIVLTALEIVHLIVLKTWNSEIFAALSGLIGTITGLFIGTKS